MVKLTGGNKLLDVSQILSKIKIEEGMKVADLGCGSTGFFVFPVAKIVGKKGEVYGVDILRNALENINRRARQENINNVKTVWTDLEVFNATKIETASLDTALIINTLYLSHKRVEIMREAMRMVRTGGKVVVIEWKNVASPFGPPSEERVKEELLKEGGKKLGLKLEEEFFAGRYHYGVIFTK